MSGDVRALYERINYLFEKKDLPGLSVCVRGPEGIIFEHGYGYRDAECKKPVDGDTVFGIASMSKSLTALSCCILAVEGRMSLDDPVVKYFPEFHIPGAADECVTVRHLALHRSGIPPIEPLEWSIAMNTDERDSEWLREMRRTSPNRMDKIEDIIDYISAGNYEPLGAPGEYMSYSNEGYALLSYIVDQAAGIPLEEFLNRRIFVPLGMTRSVLDLDASEAEKLAGGNITSLFEKYDETGKVECDDHWSVLPPFRGCACVKSTAKDITKYYQMLASGGMWEGRQVIPREAVEMLCGSEYPLRRKPYYTLGLWKRKFAGHMICEHSGGLHGVSTEGGFIDNGFSAAVLCNKSEEDMDEFLWACFNFVLGLSLDTPQHWTMPSGRPFSMNTALCGEYLVREGVPCTLKVYESENGELLASVDGEEYILKYCEQSVFAVFPVKDTASRVNTYCFYIRNGKAWGVKCGSRIWQRKK